MVFRVSEDLMGCLAVAVFDRLVEMIPANVYVAKDNPTDQWVSSLQLGGGRVLWWNCWGAGVSPCFVVYGRCMG